MKSQVKNFEQFKRLEKLSKFLREKLTEQMNLLFLLYYT